MEKKIYLFLSCEFFYKMFSAMLDPKLLSLLVLTVQNTCLVLTMRISRTQVAGPMYLASVAVMSDELMKLVTCSIMLILAYLSVAKSTGGYQMVGGTETDQGSSVSVSGFVAFLKAEVFKSTFEFCKMAVPAICYAVQKNLLFVAISNLDAAVYQVAYQGKILTTAMFSVLILRKTMTTRQVFALFVLLAGVALVQLSTMDKTPSNTHEKTQRLDNALLGSLAVLGACFTSGFAAIYFEWILKYSAPQEQRPYSIWVRNFQLATFAGLSAAFGVWSKDGAAVSAKGLYQGFTPLVWLVVALEAFGGIIVALVIKYADNILKNFATAVSIVTSVVVSTLFLGFTVKPMFVIGSICVMAAVAIYTTSPKPPVKVGTPHNATPKTETSPHSAMELGAVNPPTNS